jgi:hypothetical protein
MATPNKDRIIKISKLRDLSSIKNEKILDLQFMPITALEAKESVTEFDNSVRISGKKVNERVRTIPFQAFDSLFAIASSMHSERKEYVTALYIYYGVDKNETTDTITIYPIFQPAYLEYISETNTKTGNFRIQKSPKQYYYDASQVGNKFVEYSVDSSNDYLANYKKWFTKASVNHSENTDSFASIIPFQEIYALEYDNKVGIAILYNAMQNNSFSKSILKHSILFSPDIKFNPLFMSDFEGKIANRTHLCPTYCDSSKLIPYDLE